MSSSNSWAARTREIALSFSGPQATSLYVGITVLLFLSLGTAFADIEQKPEVQLEWTGIAFQSFLISGGFFVLVSQLVRVLRNTSLVWNTLLVGILYFTTEMVRAVFVGYMSYSEGLSEDVHLPYRIVAGGLSGLVLMGILSIVLNDSVSYRTSFRKLQEDQAKALAIVNMSEAEFASQRAQLLANVKEAVTAALHAVLEKPRKKGDQVDSVVAELVKVSDDVIRPLSHQLYARTPETQINQTSAKVSLAKVFSGATTIRPFDPIAFVLIAFLLMLGATLFGTPSAPFAFSMLMAIEVWLLVVLTLLQKYFTPVLAKLRLTIRVVLFTIVIGIATTPVLIAQDLAGYLDLTKNWMYLLYWIALVQLLSWLLALYASLTHARAEVLTKQREAVERLAWTNARLGAQLWRDQTLIAKALHNDVQPVVIAGALTLQQALAERKDPDKVLKEIKKVLYDAAEFTVNPKTNQKLTSVVKGINERWSGILKLSLSISKDVSQRLHADPVCLECASDFITEFATNSVKHGRAKNGTVTVTLHRSDVIRLTMENDGLPKDDTRTSGMGSMMMQNQALRSTFVNRDGGGVRFSVDLALI